MASDQVETRKLTSQCLCKAVNFIITVPVSKLPLPTHLCHCPICRYTHGTLCIFHAPVPLGIQPEFIAPSSREALTGYRHSQAAATRFFCKTCGCHIGDEDLDIDPTTGKPEWRVATSNFDDHSESTFQIRFHFFTNAAPGGGLYQWLPKMGDREVKQWSPPPGSKDFPIPPAEPPTQEFDSEGREVLRAECHCGGVSFAVPRPTRPESTSSKFIQQFISPLDKNKWVAVLDTCDDCRLVDGAQVIPWTFVPLAQTQPRIPPDLKFGTLVTYKSSPSVLRAFCGVCGATVFFSSDEETDPNGNDTIVDLSVGILRAPEGPTADNWLTWRTGRLSFHGSGKRFDPVFAESLAKGFDEWGRKTYGESPNFDIGGLSWSETVAQK